MPTTPEALLASRIIGALRDAYPGALFWKNPAGMGRTVGMPDIEGVVEGRAIFVEVKTKGGCVSKVQEHRIRRLRGAGAIAGVARSPTEAVDLIRGDAWEPESDPTP